VSLPDLRKIAFGGDYNPEQWPEEIWTDDYRLFDAAGIDTVTLGVFDWALLQPAPDRYDFALLDRVVDRACSEGRRSAWPRRRPPCRRGWRPRAPRSTAPTSRADGTGTGNGTTPAPARRSSGGCRPSWRAGSRSGTPTGRRSSPGTSATSTAAPATAPCARTPSGHGCRRGTPRWTGSTRPGGRRSGRTGSPTGGRSSRRPRSPSTGAAPTTPPSRASPSTTGASSRRRCSRASSGRRPRSGAGLPTSPSRRTSWACTDRSTTTGGRPTSTSRPGTTTRPTTRPRRARPWPTTSCAASRTGSRSG